MRRITRCSELLHGTGRSPSVPIYYSVSGTRHPDEVADPVEDLLYQVMLCD